MGGHDEALSELRIGDLLTFLAVHRTSSITGAARELKVTASQVSKAIARMEASSHLTLLSRSTRGVTLTEAGQRILPHVDAAVSQLRLVKPRTDDDAPMQLTVAGPSYLVTLLLPVIATCQPRLRVRSLELPPALVRAHAADNFFDLALLTSGMNRLPATWTSERVGTIRKGLLAAPSVAKRLGPPPIAAERLRDLPFISPIYVSGGQFVGVDDDCPIRADDRRLGHQTQTLLTALELAVHSTQVVFGPLVSARRYLDAGTLVEIAVKDWNVSEELFLACNGDRVRARLRTAVAEAIRGVLDAGGATA